MAGARPVPGPATPIGRWASPWRWMKENLFNSKLNVVLTALCLWVLYVVVQGVFEWAFHRAQWAVILANLRIFLAGTYPRAELWRIWTALLTLALLCGLSAGVARPGARPVLLARLSAAAALLALLPFGWAVRGWLAGALACMWIGYAAARGRLGWRPWVALGWVFSLPWTLFLMWGVRGSEVLPRVETTDWGGLVLTLVLAVVCIATSFPLGVLLALGRRSSLPAVSWTCAIFIELVRGTPLVAVVFMAHLLVPIFLPDFHFDKVVRVMMGFTLFTSAYMAENVRGGLQGVPKGQYEAAAALGMSGTLTILLVVLPQAIRAVVPSIVGQFISLFKDTSLVAIIGLLDLLGIARSVMANPRWIGLQAEVYVFAAALYWIFTFTLSQSSRRVEKALGVQGTGR